MTVSNYTASESERQARSGGTTFKHRQTRAPRQLLRTNAQAHKRTSCGGFLWEHVKKAAGAGAVGPANRTSGKRKKGPDRTLSMPRKKRRLNSVRASRTGESVISVPALMKMKEFLSNTALVGKTVTKFKIPVQNYY